MKETSNKLKEIKKTWTKINEVMGHKRKRANQQNEIWIWYCELSKRNCGKSV